MADIVNYPLRYRRFQYKELEVDEEIVVYAPHTLRCVIASEGDLFKHIAIVTAEYRKEGYHVEEDGEFQCVRQTDESAV